MDFSRLRWMLLPAITSHNLEEWLFIPCFREELEATSSFAAQPWQLIELGLLIVTFVPAVIVIWASTGAQQQHKDWAICWIASIFFANVFAPHIPASILVSGYTPGIATAILVVLPISLWLFSSALREARLTRSQLAISFVCGSITLPVAIFLTLQIAELLEVSFRSEYTI